LWIPESPRWLNFGDRRALAFMVKDEGYGATWGPPPNHRGTKQQWIETLESRLQDAKSIRKRAEQFTRDLQQIAQEISFRK
jgi:hypothetical protein